MKAVGASYCSVPRRCSQTTLPAESRGEGEGLGAAAEAAPPPSPGLGGSRLSSCACAALTMPMTASEHLMMATLCLTKDRVRTSTVDSHCCPPLLVSRPCSSILSSIWPACLPFLTLPCSPSLTLP